MRTWKLAVALAACVTFAGCVSAPTITSTFDPAEAAFIHKDGKATINAQAFLRRNDGMVVYAAGSEARLIPRTRYSTERINGIYRGAKINYFVPSPPSPPGFEDAMRVTRANGEGRFSFAGVADGDYYLVTSVIWMVGSNQQGGTLLENVSVRNGTDVEVIMTGS